LTSFGKILSPRASCSCASPPVLSSLIRSYAAPLGTWTGVKTGTGAGRDPASLDGQAARKHGLTVGQVEEWREVCLLGAENALRSRPRDDEALKDEQIKRLKQKVGELVLHLDIPQEATKGRPFARTTSDE
jgi:hypothetical protein